MKIPKASIGKYRVDVETKSQGQNGPVMLMVPYSDEKGTSEKMARSLAASLKRVGCGGQLVQIGTGPNKTDEKVESWDSVGRFQVAREQVGNTP